MDDLDKNLRKFLQRHSELEQWQNIEIPKLREHLKVTNYNFYESSITNIETYWNLISVANNNKEARLNILFAQFPPYSYEVESLGLPTYFKKYLPNCEIHTLSWKNSEKPFLYEIKEKKIVKIHNLLPKYDIIVARSSILIELMKSKEYKKILESSRKVINVKTMSYRQNYRHADFYFEESQFCPPPDPMFIEKIQKSLNRYSKKNIILIPGTVSQIKNQLDFFKNINPSTIKNFELVIAGKIVNPKYFKKITKICKKKNLSPVFLGEICQDLLIDVMSLSKISIHTMDMRINGQKEGYPRLLGETIGSKSLTIANYPITVPDYFDNYVFKYGGSFDNLNLVLQNAIDKAEDSNFISNYCLDYTFEDFCESKLNEIIKVGGNN